MVPKRPAGGGLGGHASNAPRRFGAYGARDWIPVDPILTSF